MSGGFRATHVVAAGGVAAFAGPDAGPGAIASLAAGAELQTLQVQGGWAQVQAASGWIGWVPITSIAPPPATGRKGKWPLVVGGLVALAIVATTVIVASGGDDEGSRPGGALSGTSTTRGGTTATSRPEDDLTQPPGLDEAFLSGLDSELAITEADLVGLFEVTKGTVEPHPLAPPPAQTDAAVVSQAGAGIGEYADVTTEAGVPADFAAYIAGGALLGVTRWDALYPDPFSFRDSARSRHFRLVITTDPAPFNALAHTTTLRHGFASPCGNAPVADRAECVPEVRVLFEAGRWDGRTYPPMTPERVAHEVFHVGHMYLLRSLGKPELFLTPGYYWQGEGFATVSQRLLPDPTAYDTFSAGLIDESYFRWPALSDANYERAYEVSSFLDELVFQSGDDPLFLLRWLKETRPAVPSSLSLMRLVAPAGADGVDLNRFQSAYMRAVMGLRYPGFLPSVNPRTAGVLDYPSSDAALTSDDLPLRVNTTVPVLGHRVVRVGVSSLPDDPTGQLAVSVRSAGEVRAVLFAERGDRRENFQFCQRMISATDGAARATAVKECFRNHVRAFGVVGSGDGAPVTVSMDALRAFSPDLSKLRISVMLFGLDDGRAVVGGIPPPATPVSVSIDGATTKPRRENRTVTLDFTSGELLYLLCEDSDGGGIRLLVDYDNGTVLGRCDYVEKDPRYSPNVVGYDIEGAVDEEGNIVGRVLNGTVTRAEFPPGNQVGQTPLQLEFSGDFTGQIHANGEGEGSVKVTFVEIVGDDVGDTDESRAGWDSDPE